MNRTRLLYGILSLMVVIAAGYFAFTFLTPPEAFPSATTLIKGANTDFVNSKNFSTLQVFVNLPIKATDVGWPSPFQSIYERGIPGIYVPPKVDTNENANGNTNIPKPY